MSTYRVNLLLQHFEFITTSSEVVHKVTLEDTEGSRNLLGISNNEIFLSFLTFFESSEIMNHCQTREAHMPDLKFY